MWSYFFFTWKKIEIIAFFWSWNKPFSLETAGRISCTFPLVMPHSTWCFSMVLRSQGPHLSLCQSPAFLPSSFLTNFTELQELGGKTERGGLVLSPVKFFLASNIFHAEEMRWNCSLRFRWCLLKNISLSVLPIHLFLPLILLPANWVLP